jgi:Cytochrome b5-like Heme/Steroid binding domain
MQNAEDRMGQRRTTPCVLTIDGRCNNVTAWANAHPGGSAILHKFHRRDASKAFAAAHHSSEAYHLLSRFLVVEVGNETTDVDYVGQVEQKTVLETIGFQKIRRKLFTKEDPVGVHKYLGIFCLLNFVRMYYQMYFGDPAAGLAAKGHPWLSVACLVPHGLLSVSSLIFDNVPKERVVGKPTIWQEFRAHNIIFGVRSVLTTFAATLTIRAGNTKLTRRLAVAVSGACVLAANVAADLATHQLRVVSAESTTATMPYWEGCSLATQKRFKSFYAYCQFMATLACLVSGEWRWVANRL